MRLAFLQTATRDDFQSSEEFDDEGNTELMACFWNAEWVSQMDHET